MIDAVPTNKGLTQAFNNIDIDESGSITKQEFYDHFKESGNKMSREEYDVLFNLIDKDNSGCIDLAEYCFFMEQVQKKMNGDSRRRKSVMKVNTQSNSLSNSSENKIDKRKQLQDQKKNKSPTRSSKFLSMRKMRNFRVKNLDLDKSLAKGEPAGSSNKLRFFDVEVREYEVTVSDNPGVKSGVAIELGWKYDIKERTHIDNFEEKRSMERSKNFTKEKKLTRLEREKLLREFGATDKEIQQAGKRSAEIRNKRRKSIEMRQHDKFHETVERRLSSFKDIFSRRSSKKVDSSDLDMERLHPTLLAMMEDISESDRVG